MKTATSCAVLLAVGVSACLRHPDVDGRPISACTLGASSSLIEARVTGWGWTQERTYPGFAPANVTPLTLASVREVRGDGGTYAPVFVGGNVDWEGGSEEGPLRDTSGYLFLLRRGDDWLVSYQGLFVLIDGGLVRNEGLYFGGIAEADFLARALGDAGCSEDDSGL